MTAGSWARWLLSVPNQGWLRSSAWRATKKSESTDSSSAETESGKFFLSFLHFERLSDQDFRVDVIIDDQLFLNIPLWEALTKEQKSVYHGDRDLYEKVGLKGGSVLYFARGQNENETWVWVLFSKNLFGRPNLIDNARSPLLEKVIHIVLKKIPNLSERW